MLLDFNIHQFLLFLFDNLLHLILEKDVLLPLLPGLLPVFLPVFFKDRLFKLLLFELAGLGTLLAKQFSNFLFQKFIGPIPSAFHPLVHEGVVPVLDHMLCSSAIELLGNL